MGVVVRAQDTRLAREVAIKIFLPNASRRKDSKLRFLQQAKAAAVVRHPNVVTIHAVEEATDTPFLVMELIENSLGMTLKFVEDSGYATVVEASGEGAKSLDRTVDPSRSWRRTARHRLSRPLRSR